MRLPSFTFAGRLRSRLVYLWITLVAVSYLVFPPIPVGTLEEDRAVIATSVDGDWMATIATKLPEDETIALGHYFGPIQLWDMRREHLHATIAENQSRVRTVRFTPNSEYVIAQCDDKLHVWETDTGNELLTLEDGELHSLVTPESGPPLAVMLRATDAGRYTGDACQVNLIEIPSAELKATIGPVQVANDTEFFWGRDKATLRISADGSVAVTYSSPAEDRTLEFLVWTLLSGEKLGSIQVATYPRGWALSPDGTKLIHLTRARRIDFWDLTTGTLQASIKPDEDSLEALVLANGFRIDYAEYPTLMRVYTLGGVCLIHFDGKRFTRLADSLTSAISPDGSLVALEQGNVIRIPFLGHIQTQSIAITRMPDLEVIRTIDSPRNWPKDSVAFNPVTFSEDGEKPIYVDYTDNSLWATLQAYSGDLWNGSIIAGKSSGRTHSLRCLDITSGKTDVIFRTTRITFGGRLLAGSKHFITGRSIWRVPSSSPWLLVLGGPTLIVAVLLGIRFIRQRRAQTD